MLNTVEIIDLFHKGTYDAIMDNLKIIICGTLAPRYKILIYAIKVNNIELITELFVAENLSSRAIIDIMAKPELYPTLEFLLESNRNNLCVLVRKILKSDALYSIKRNMNVELLNIINTYLRSDYIMERICDGALNTHQLEILDELFKLGHDIKSAINAIMVFRKNNPNITVCEPKIIFDTYIYLEKYGVDCVSYINIIGIIFYHTGDIKGLEYCLENGLDANYVLGQTRSSVSVDTINCLLKYGADLNILNLENIEHIISTCDVNLSVTKYLVDNGLELNNYFNQLLLYTVTHKCYLTMAYLIDLGADVNMEDGLILYYACRLGSVECVNYIVDLGANMCTGILLFVGYTPFAYTLGYGKWFEIAKKLLAHGAQIKNPMYIFCLYISRLAGCAYDAELFTYFLDNLCIDLNGKFDVNIKMKSGCSPDIKYILDAVVWFGPPAFLKLCLAYGADPYINNHSPLMIAIYERNFVAVKILLELGSTVDSYFVSDTSKEIIELLDGYGIKKID
jgi:ankyrin repeat protein